MFCSKCGAKVHDEAVVCTNCGCAIQNTTKPSLKEDIEDKVSVGLCILSILIPLFGIIYWPLKHKETPKKARACGISAIISWVAYIILIIVIYTAIISAASTPYYYY